MSEDHAAAAGQAPECQFCPLCQAMAALRSARPEAVEHLLKAGAEDSQLYLLKGLAGRDQDAARGAAAGGARSGDAADAGAAAEEVLNLSARARRAGAAVGEV